MQHEIPESKLCPNCNVEKPSSEYHRNAARRDGLTYVCAKCIPIYEAKEKRPKRNLSDFHKDCVKCGRHLTARMFQYAQNTEDHLRESCRTCSAFKSKFNPTIEQINFYESTMNSIFKEAKEKFNVDTERSKLENFVHKKMIDLGIDKSWNPPVWVHKTSKGE